MFAEQLKDSTCLLLGGLFLLPSMERKRTSLHPQLYPSEALFPTQVIRKQVLGPFQVLAHHLPKLHTRGLTWR